MNYWDEESYFEPSEFDEKIEELKEELKKSVRQEIKDEVEKLRNENRELQDIKKNFEAVKRDFERKKAECDRVMKEAEFKASQARLTELMDKHFKVVLWAVNKDYVYKKKCDKCDNNRQIKVTLPSGKVVLDDCRCRESKEKYSPQKNVLYRLSENSREINAWYRKEGRKGEEYFTEGLSSVHANVIVNHDKDFKKLAMAQLYGVFFTTEEECQEFCDFLNAQNKIEEYEFQLDGMLTESNRGKKRLTKN